MATPAEEDSSALSFDEPTQVFKLLDMFSVLSSVLPVFHGYGTGGLGVG